MLRSHYNKRRIVSRTVTKPADSGAKSSHRGFWGLTVPETGTVCNVPPRPQPAVATNNKTIQRYFISFPDTARIEKLKAEDFDVNQLLYIVDPEVSEDEKLTALADITEADMSDRVRSDNEESLEKILNDILDGETDLDVNLLDEVCDYPDVCHVST